MLISMNWNHFVSVLHQKFLSCHYRKLKLTLLIFHTQILSNIQDLLLLAAIRMIMIAYYVKWEYYIIYARSNRIVRIRLFHSYSSDVLLELGRSFVDRFTVDICGHVTKLFPKFVWHTTTYIVKFCMFQVAAVTVLFRYTLAILHEKRINPPAVLRQWCHLAHNRI